MNALSGHARLWVEQAIVYAEAAIERVCAPVDVSRDRHREFWPVNSAVSGDASNGMIAL
jgi:hypothetical protein